MDIGMEQKPQRAEGTPTSGGGEASRRPQSSEEGRD
jgi:hypothetical protein